jgi:hypothetical protein
LSSKSDIWSLAGVIWDLMNSKRGYGNEEGKRGLNFLRERLNRDIKRGGMPFEGEKYPSHRYMDEVLDRRNDLPAYTTWLKGLGKYSSCNRRTSRGAR